jgi:hypothetical protein
MTPEPSNFKRSELSVWRTKGDMIIKNLSPQGLSEVLGKIDVDDKNTIESVNDEVKVVDLGLSLGEALLV